MSKTPLIFSAAFAAFAAAAAFGQEAPPPALETIVDEWHAVFSAGRKAGHAHVGFWRTASNGVKVIRGEKTVDMTLGGPERPLAVRIVSRSLEIEEDGKLLEMETTRQVGDRTSRASVKIDAGMAELSVDGAAPLSFPAPDGVAGPYASYSAARTAAAKGVEAALPEYDPFTGTVEWTRKPAGEESVPISGRVVLLRKFVATEPGGTVVSEWRDSEGRLRRTHDPREDLVTVSAGHDEATRVPSDYRILVPAAGERRKPGGKAVFIFEGALAGFGLESPDQAVAPSGSGVKVTVDRPAPFPPTVDRPVSGGMDAAGFMGFDRFTDWMNAAVGKKAAELTVSIPDALEAAVAIARWVGSNVTLAEEGPFHTAPEALAAGASSSAGRAVLCCALCRGASIPARIVAGLKADGEGLRLCFWVEAFAGRWVSIDPEAQDGLAEFDQVRLRILDTRAQHPEAFFSALAFDAQKTRIRRE